MTIADGSVVPGATKIVDNGPNARRWNVVILGDGYQAAELNQYHNDVDAFVQYFRTIAPFDQLWGKINIHRVDVISTESFADDPVGCGDGSSANPVAGLTAATYFDSTFCSDGTRRRLLAGVNATAQSVSHSEVPDPPGQTALPRLTMVLVNSPRFGGSGGEVAWFSSNVLSAEIAVHELAHTAFLLMDEYGDGQPRLGPSPNVTTETNLAAIPWRDLILTAPVPTMSNPDPAGDNRGPSPFPDGTVGLFEGAGGVYQGVYRSEYDCAMRTPGLPFCKVCQRQIRLMLSGIGGSMSWETTGNSGTDPATDFLGTTDNQPLVIKINGAERVRIAAAGNTGIGTAQPSARLSVAAVGAVELTGTARSRTLLASSGALGTAAGSELALTTFGFNASGPGVSGGYNSSLGIRALRVTPGSSWTSTAIGLGMDVDDSVRAGASLWLRANGNVGVGTSDPGAKLEINNGDLLLKGGTSKPGDIIFQGSSGPQKGRIWSEPGSGLNFNHGGKDPDVCISSKGDVGIGTSNPRAKLEIDNGDLLFDAKSGANIVFRTAGAEKGRIFADSTAGYGLHLSGGNPNPDVSINAAGNVGIGTKTPGAKLEISNGNLLLNGGAASGLGQLVFQGASSIRGRIWLEPAGLRLSGGSPNPDIIINAAGNVGIGTNQPGSRLEVRATAPGGPALTAQNAADGEAIVGMCGSPGNRLPAVVATTFGTASGTLARAIQITTTSFGMVGLAGPNAPLPVANAAGGIGVVGSSPAGAGVAGITDGLGAVANGVEGVHDNASGVGAGLHGRTDSPNGVGVFGVNFAGGLAGSFVGHVAINGTVLTSGKQFRIDHPLAPAEKYLNHSSIESPDRMNVYNGNIRTGGDREAVVELPDYFEVLNRDFRYQLTVIGDFAQAVVAREVKGNRFVIRTDRPNVKVSWQVTGIRKDAYAEAHPMIVEEKKTGADRGRYLHPELYAAKSAKPEAKRPIGSFSGMFARQDAAAPKGKAKARSRRKK